MRMKRVCMICDRREMTQEVEEVIMCEECGGAFVDEFKVFTYRAQLGVPDRLGRQKKTNNKTLLVIELEKLGDVPKVFLNGNEIPKKEDVKFTWSTRDAVEASATELTVKHFDHDGLRNAIQIRKEGEMDHGTNL